ncbi:MAG: extracellular solute-binding protein [Armatimonadetes bacterium]|nr:extracellular solute-binding protein [Armatimonadota bacterium]MDE2206425.1 extracellular solute-binding protein [Armatimonadota bacterium]
MRRPALLLLLLPLCLAGCHLQPPGERHKTEIEVAVFEGGYGISWHKSIARAYERLHPGIHVNLWGDPRVDEKLKPRILRSDPPDAANSSLPFWKLIVANKLYPLDAALDSPAYGAKGTWRSTLVPGVLADSQYEGKTYAIPSNLSAWVCWYDQRMFDAHGWSVPQTWGQFMRLCAQIKAAHIAPLAFQGKYPYYAWATLLSLYQRIVPWRNYYAMQDAQPGAFLDPGFVRAATMMQQMALNYYEPGALAMTHTESQMEWCNGRAAMVFCGLWLENEMKNAIPKGFRMACFKVPPVTGGLGDPNAVYAGGGEDFVVFREAKHPRLAADFLKFMVSRQSSKSYITQLDTLSPVIGAADGLKLSSALSSAVTVLGHADHLFSDRLSGLYLDWNRNVVSDALGDLVSGHVTPLRFAQRLEAGMQAVRANPDIYKPPARGVPWQHK